jgi:hypothetical protein
MAERSAPPDVAAMDARIASVVETMKWKKPSNPVGVPVWERAGGGILCTGDAFKDKVKLTFGRGAMLSDPDGVFNAGLNGNAMRAIDLREGETVDPAAFRELVQAAAADQAAQRQKH